MSGPPAFRGARLEEMPGGSVAQIRNHFGDESPNLSHPNKENSPLERGDANDGRHLAGNGSVDSGVDTNVSFLQFSIPLLHELWLNLSLVSEHLFKNKHFS